MSQRSKPIRLKRRPRAGPPAVRAAAGGSVSGGMRWNGYGGQGYGWRLLLPGTQYDYEAAAGDLWRNSTVAACLRWVKINFPEPTLQAVNDGPDGPGGEIEVLKKHPCVALLNRPNPFYDRYTFWAAMSLSAIVDGNAYAIKIRSAAGGPVQLWWVPHWLIWPRWNQDGSEFVGWYEYSINGRLIRLPVADVIHYRSGIDPRDDRKGFSELKQAVRAICGLNEADTYTASLLRNMGMPSALISFDGDTGLQLDDVSVLQDQWREQFTSEGRGNPLFAPRKMRVEKLSFSPEEMRLDQLPARLEDQVCAATGIPAMVVGVTSGAQHKTYANYGEARRAAYEDCLIPLQKSVAECLTYQLLLPDFSGAERLRWDYSTVQCLAENETELAVRIGQQYQTYQTIMRSEARAALGYDSTEEDEVFFAAAAQAALPPPTEPPLIPPQAGTEEEPETEPETETEPDDDDEARGREYRRPFPPDRRSRTEGTPPGDVDDPDEDNTFGLPEGVPIRRALKRFAKRQLKQMLGVIPGIGAPIPDKFPPLTDWDDPMAAAMTPLISAYWDEAGQVTRERLGLDPEAWEVHDPHLHDMITKQSFDFCAETNATTTTQLNEALRRLKTEFVQGLVEHGDTIPELTARVKSVFGGLTDDRAEMIARTESSRAVHRAGLQSAKESDVVAGKKWLLSANACPLCHRLRDAVPANGIPLENDFGTVGSHPEYSKIVMPPAHPHCRCTTTYVLIPEYQALVDANPPPGFKPGPMGPDPGRNGTAGPPPAPAAAAEPKAKPAKKEPILKGQALIDRSHEILTGMGVSSEAVGLTAIQAAMPTKFLTAKMPAVFDDAQSKVYINTDSEYWANPKKVLETSRKEHWFAVHEPEHIAIHEGVHALHLDHLTKELGDREAARGRMKAMALAEIPIDQRRIVQKKVGRYAAISEAEFVAEVGAAMIEGKTYGADIMAMYGQYHGPMEIAKP